MPVCSEVEQVFHPLTTTALEGVATNIQSGAIMTDFITVDGF